MGEEYKVSRARTTKELRTTAERYFAGVEAKYDTYRDSIDVPSIGFSINKKEDRVYDDAMQAAVHIMLCSFNEKSINSNNPMRTHYINEDMITSRFMFKSRLTDKRKKVHEAIDSLERKGLIIRQYVNPEDVVSKSSMFRVEHTNSFDKSIKGRRFLTIPNRSFNKVLSLSETDAEKINMIAVMGSLFSRMNIPNKKNCESVIAWTSILGTLQALSFEGMESIGHKVNLTNDTVSTYLSKLEELKVVSRIKARRYGSNSVEWTYYYSKFEERALLRNHFERLSETVMPYEKRYYNLVDIWDDKMSESKGDIHIPVTYIEEDGHLAMPQDEMERLFESI